jgi:hypothetical protein
MENSDEPAETNSNQQDILNAILQRLENIEAQLSKSKSNLLPIESRQKTGNMLVDYFSNKQQMIKDDIREFMLSNFNIESLEDNTEGDIYDYIVDQVFNLTVGRFF